MIRKNTKMRKMLTFCKKINRSLVSSLSNTVCANRLKICEMLNRGSLYFMGNQSAFCTDYKLDLLQMRLNTHLSWDKMTNATTVYRVHPPYADVNLHLLFSQ